jgi:Spy/CpxP family protein refolding chaperone
LCILAAVGIVALPSATLAQDAAPARQGRGQLDPAARLKLLTERLSLTEDQQAKIKAIYEKNAPLTKDLLAKGRQNLTDEERTKLREINKAQTDEIDAILTPEQKTKLKELRAAGRPGEAAPAKPDAAK